MPQKYLPLDGNDVFRRGITREKLSLLKTNDGKKIPSLNLFIPLTKDHKISGVSEFLLKQLNIKQNTLKHFVAHAALKAKEIRQISLKGHLGQNCKLEVFVNDPEKSPHCHIASSQNTSLKDKVDEDDLAEELCYIAEIREIGLFKQ